jgi:hypothetical protein
MIIIGGRGGDGNREIGILGVICIHFEYGLAGKLP